MKLKALSIQPPWPWCIVAWEIGGVHQPRNRFPRKDVENRTWKTNHRGLLLIHAGRTFDYAGHDFIRRRFNVHAPLSSWPSGGVVGVALLSGITNHDETPLESPWAFGPYCWHLSAPRQVPFSPLRGQQGLFEVNAADTGELLPETRRAVVEYMDEFNAWPKVTA
jgi:hypothetical protein